jgi:hypothetical protein
MTGLLNLLDHIHHIQDRTISPDIEHQEVY